MRPMGRSVSFFPGHWKPDSKGTMNIRFVYRGKRGAVSWAMTTGWYPVPPRPEPVDYADRNRPNQAGLHPYGLSIVYHTPEPIREWQGREQPPATDEDDFPEYVSLPGECDILDGECWSDGSATAGHELTTVLIYEGEEALWARLEAYYASTFGVDAPEPEEALIG